MNEDIDGTVCTVCSGVVNAESEKAGQKRAGVFCMHIDEAKLFSM